MHYILNKTSIEIHHFLTKRTALVGKTVPVDNWEIPRNALLNSKQIAKKLVQESHQIDGWCYLPQTHAHRWTFTKRSNQEDKQANR